MSTTSMHHFSQIYLTTELKMYDYNKEGNLKHYGQEKPPFYNLSEITLPTHIFVSDGDFPCRPEVSRWFVMK